MMARTGDILSIEPRGLNRVAAASYFGVSPSFFDKLVTDGRAPRPKRINCRCIWDRRELDESFDALPRDGEVSSNPWEE